MLVADDALAIRERGAGQATLSYDDLLGRFRELVAAGDPAS